MVITRHGALLDTGPETLAVQLRKPRTDSLGSTTWLNDGDPVEVKGAQVEPVTTDEAQSLGLEMLTSYRVTCRGPWPERPTDPGAVHSRITWNGREWDQRGEPRRYGRGRLTRHVVVFISARGAR